MRENRTYGSEGGAELITRFLPLSIVTASGLKSSTAKAALPAKAGTTNNMDCVLDLLAWSLGLTWHVAPICIFQFPILNNQLLHGRRPSGFVGTMEQAGTL